MGSTYNDTMSGAGETLSSLSEKSDTYFTADHHRHDLEVSDCIAVARVLIKESNFTFDSRTF